MSDGGPVATGSSDAPAFTWRGALRRGWEAGRANLLPGIILWIVAILVVAAYYGYQPTQDALVALAEVKERMGFAFAMLSTAFFAGILPMLFQHLQRAGTQRDPLRLLPILLVFWAYKGFEVELLYHLQAWAWGDDQHWDTVVIKVLIDQFVYVPFWASPTLILFYQWKAAGFEHTRTREAMGRNWLLHHVVPITLSNWIVWIPTVIAIYLLPLPLQLPLQNIVLCLWVLMLMVMTRK